MRTLLPLDLDLEPDLGGMTAPHRTIATPLLDRELRRSAAEVLGDARCPVCGAPLNLRHGTWGPGYFCRCTRYR